MSRRNIILSRVLAGFCHQSRRQSGGGSLYGDRTTRRVRLAGTPGAKCCVVRAPHFTREPGFCKQLPGQSYVRQAREGMRLLPHMPRLLGRRGECLGSICRRTPGCQRLFYQGCHTQNGNQSRMPCATALGARPHVVYGERVPGIFAARFTRDAQGVGGFTLNLNCTRVLGGMARTSPGPLDLCDWDVVTICRLVVTGQVQLPIMRE